MSGFFQKVGGGIIVLSLIFSVIIGPSHLLRVISGLPNPVWGTDWKNSVLWIGENIVDRGLQVVTVVVVVGFLAFSIAARMRHIRRKS